LALATALRWVVVSMCVLLLPPMPALLSLIPALLPPPLPLPLPLPLRV
jgi:hypothetical protein